MSARLLSATVVVCVASIIGAAQTPARRLTTVDGLRNHPGYFHLQNVLVHGEFDVQPGRIALRGGDTSLPVLLDNVGTPDGLMEVRAQFIDVGRLEPGDPRSGREFTRDTRWPNPGEELLLRVTAVSPAQLETTASVRALALQPWRFEGQTVTVVGQFRGRNLYADLPSAPGTSANDFVLRSADAAVWTTTIRPRGQGFNLDVDARVDTGRWLQVTGVVGRQRGLVTILGSTVAAVMAPAIQPVAADADAPPTPRETGEVVFSSPSEDEIGVTPNGRIRIQFSRGLTAASLQGRIRVSYLGNPAPIEFQQSYDANNRALEIRFPQPLERFTTVRIELLEGITTFDGGAVKPWTLTFSVGG